MRYSFKDIEAKWQKYWKERRTYRTQEDTAKPKCYVLDMFPYPSGAGLHVGHPLGYVASDVYARFKRLQGFNVLHPIGFDAFGLPAEQFAIQTGQHPEQSTQKNINNFKAQLEQLALSYDWDRALQTCDPNYYRWTQWIFLQIFNSWFNRHTQKAEPIAALIAIFEKEGNRRHPIPQPKLLSATQPEHFDAAAWNNYNEQEKSALLMQYRLAYLAETEVNWCAALGTVLANDEVINGLSYRGAHPVVKRRMTQWHLRISEYADRLLEGLERIDFSPSMKEIQRNWIGKSTGADIHFPIENHSESLCIFTTRPDTIFGVSFMVLAPEHPLIPRITTPEQRETVTQYVARVQNKSEVERMSNVKNTNGCFTGAYALHCFTKERIPIWVSEYVVMGYGTGSIMGVPYSDERDKQFARHFNLPILPIFDADQRLINSYELNGLDITTAQTRILTLLEENNIGSKKINYKMRDAGWSRQRYWGEPFPVFYDEQNIARPMDEADLPLTLPPTQKFTPPGNGAGPLAHLGDWIHFESGKRRDSSTMPTHAGAAWYFLRYADPHNTQAFADKRKSDYWGAVDVYVGGSEHAVSHLLYARLWTKILFDLEYISFDEPFKKLINQGKITAQSAFVYRIRGTQQFVSYPLKDTYKTDALHVDIHLLKENNQLNISAFKQWLPEFTDATFILENDTYICGRAIEKMSKSKFNVVNPNRIIAEYGSDTFRMYELFLGPLEQSKPWDTQGIEGVHRFLKKLWRLFYADPEGTLLITDTPPAQEELKILHQCIEKVSRDTESFSLNTAVSAFMVAVNELTKCRCHKKSILEPFLILLSPYAPHITEELWQHLGHQSSISYAALPVFNPKYTAADNKLYPVSVNGKVRAHIPFSFAADEAEILAAIQQNEALRKWLQQPIKKLIYVRGKIINILT